MSGRIDGSVPPTVGITGDAPQGRRCSERDSPQAGRRPARPRHSAGQIHGFVSLAGVIVDVPLDTLVEDLDAAVG